MAQHPGIIITGISGSGKSTLARIIKDASQNAGYVEAGDLAARIPLYLATQGFSNDGAAKPVNIHALSLQALAGLVAEVHAANVDWPNYDVRIMTNMVEELRTLHGPSYPGELFLGLPRAGFTILSGLRHPASVELVKKEGYYAIGLQCSPEVAASRLAATTIVFCNRLDLALDFISREEKVFSLRHSIELCDAIFASDTLKPNEIYDAILPIINPPDIALSMRSTGSETQPSLL